MNKYENINLLIFPTGVYFSIQVLLICNQLTRLKNKFDDLFDKIKLISKLQKTWILLINNHLLSIKQIHT